ncbi:hypothetical protein FHS29_003921 [Saccharothrix tamanrassetensis]|uniref:Cholesterol esterase n=1 Tax=Saccharothrix tamanrassetensis TaxID=1051531 RepID=A0A841CMF5_9PSEU|nr:DUF6230 family protein [Saccharothrix tamanrassetensis]MBB5957328.1 hypothetical protein [Saccharothrix tamanrassetensis]
MNPATTRRPVGRTSRRRLLLAAAPTALAATALLTGIARGAVGVSFSSETPFTITLDRLEATGFGLGLAGSTAAPGTATLLTRLGSAEITGLCQSATVDLPVIGPVTTVLRAPHVTATDLVLETQHIAGTLDLRQFVLGPTAPNATVGYQAATVTLENATIRGGSATAGTFELDGLDIGYEFDGGGCRTEADR